MSRGTINSDDINSTSYPGSEDGLSLIELIGSVEVQCYIPAVGLLLSAAAVTSASASGVVSNTTAKMLLSATTDPSAVTQASARSKVFLSPQVQSAQAATSAATATRSAPPGGPAMAT